MISSFLQNIKEAVTSVVPVMVIVLLLHLTIAPLAPGETPRFLLGGVMLKVGDKVLDASLRAQLQILKEQIKRGE